LIKFTITKKEFIGEFIGTFFILLLGNGVVASVVLFGLGNFESINWAWGFAVLFGILVSSKLSGAHLNPAVTIALAFRRNFPITKVLPYIFAQLLGAFFGSLLVYLNYREGILHFEEQNLLVRGSIESIKLASIFATYPPSFISNTSAFIDQVLGTGILVFLILAVTDEKNKIFDSNLSPFLVSMIVIVIGMSFGANAGYAINPARDFAPRLMTYLMGWGTIVFTVKHFYFLIPIFAPIIGGILGAYLYDLIIQKHLD
jgi:glycerol uptake facilitator protein